MRKLFKGGNYSREETIHGNTVIDIYFVLLLSQIMGIPDTFAYSYQLNEYAVLEGGAIITSLDLI